MSSTAGIRDDRHHDGCPAADVARSVRIGVGNVSTAFADKLALRSSVCLLAPALVAGLRGVGRIDADEGYPGKPALVLEGSREAVRKPTCRADGVAIS